MTVPVRRAVTGLRPPVTTLFIINGEHDRGLLLAYGLYFASLCYCYIHSVAPINESTHFLYLRVNQPKLIEAFLLSSLALITVPVEWKKPSDFGVSILFFIGLVPSCVIYGLSDQSRPFMYTLMAGYLAVIAFRHISVPVPRVRLRIGEEAAPYTALALIVLSMIWYFAVSASPIPNFDLIAVYDFRDAALETFSTFPMNYIAAAVPRVLNPFLICYCLFKRRWLQSGFFFVFQLFLLGVYQEKIALIPCVLISVIYAVCRGRRAARNFIYALTLLAVAFQLRYELSGDIWGIQMFVRRFLFAQQFLYFDYYQVFSDIGQVHLSNGILAWLWRYPFPYEPTAMVAYYLTGVPGGNPNTGFFGSGYMHFGTIGVPLWGAVIGMALSAFDRAVPREVPMWFFCGVAGLPFFAFLVAQDLTPSFMSGGVAPLFVLMVATRLNADRQLGPAKALAAARHRVVTSGYLGHSGVITVSKQRG